MKKLLLSLVFLCGCFNVSDANNYLNYNIYEVPYATITEFWLKDKTQCVIYSGHKKGGITCNWENQ